MVFSSCFLAWWNWHGERNFGAKCPNLKIFQHSNISSSLYDQPSQKHNLINLPPSIQQEKNHSQNSYPTKVLLTPTIQKDPIIPKSHPKSNHPKKNIQKIYNPKKKNVPPPVANPKLPFPPLRFVPRLQPLPATPLRPPSHRGRNGRCLEAKVFHGRFGLVGILGKSHK